MIWDWRWAKEPPMQGESEIEEMVALESAFERVIARIETAAEARGYERCLKEIDEKCPEVAHIVRARINAK